MASTITLECPTGTAKVYLSPRSGATGTPTVGGYTPTQIAGLVHTITVAGLDGKFVVAAGSLNYPSTFYSSVTIVDGENQDLTEGGGSIPDDLSDQLDRIEERTKKIRI